MIYVKHYHGENQNVETSLIWGTTWDNAVKFLVETGNKGYSELTDSTTWGNYKGAGFEYTKLDGTTAYKEASSSTATAVLIPTGSTEYTNSCNIYDLAGNLCEWNQRIINTTSGGYIRVQRGGAYNLTGTSYYVLHGIHGNTVPNTLYSYGTGCRAVLWIS